MIWKVILKIIIEYNQSEFWDRLDQKYDSPGSKELVLKIKDLIEDVNFDSKWGIEHGVWCALSKMYPNAGIPIVELSLNRKLSMQQHYELGKKLYKLREEGILIFCTGNVVHNLMMAKVSESPYKWAINFDEKVKEFVIARKGSEIGKLRVNWRRCIVVC